MRFNKVQAIVSGLIIGLWISTFLSLLESGVTFNTWMYLLVATNFTTAFAVDFAHRSRIAN